MREVVHPEGRQVSYEAYGYSAAVRSRGFLFVSGQVGIDETGAAIRDPARQFDSAFSNLGQVLSAAGCSFEDVVDITSFHVSMHEHWDDFAAAKQKVFPDAPFPSWTAIGVASLAAADLLLEIKAIAQLK